MMEVVIRLVSLLITRYILVVSHAVQLVAIWYYKRASSDHIGRCSTDMMSFRNCGDDYQKTSKQGLNKHEMETLKSLGPDRLSMFNTTH
ncbi:hypothetical protein RHMOL_Rhmol13G0034400 [Rhododendron molle]|uniref:Uncharacterized protein n=1 Tax=Rhododendron molle TaxID=49168 RepID=A0ACC0L312_RHOML|nr:hypothetical protein RHMOL_Rhmol13G0034400 [Rhododendron molle]